MVGGMPQSFCTLAQTLIRILMLKSMTGFGKAECLLPSKKLTIELKSLNSKQMDTSLRLPSIYREKDLEIRQILASSLERGKIECNFHYELTEGASASVNRPMLREYVKQLKEVASEFNLEQTDLISAAMRLPDTLISGREELEAEEWQTVLMTLSEAIRNHDEFRTREGKALEEDLQKRISVIQEKQASIKPFEEERLSKLKGRIQSNLQELFPGNEVDQNRFEQELLFYIEKIDITEEQVRLKTHLEYFLEIIDEGSPNGKKLSFISQEIGREINTLGSKANHGEIQRLVVEMKDELEKIKEQVLNVL